MSNGFQLCFRVTEPITVVDTSTSSSSSPTMPSAERIPPKRPGPIPLVVGCVLGACGFLAFLITVLVRRRFRRRATALAQPRALPPPSTTASVRKDGIQIPEAPPVACVGTSVEAAEYARLRETVAALQNEVQELRQGNIAEWLPVYEHRTDG
ncbi:hypothetical protein EXIGLDRAFT_764218 [Exidia glandulosa HHB12029]|uniref:Uncharacterized protein n=1 Tax=Exidia glandulosa HHB12029 TaxID=1314781 RepID=A0A166B433_EXIGL|nr:hypothetical protein EXIGLDRAFT_764218 [Exidia glandulosa HHB12029]